MGISGEAPAMPPLSELLAWAVDHLIDGATSMAATADRWESAYTSMWQDAYTVDWKGAAADATRARLTSDKTRVSGGSERLRAGAKVARAGASDVLSARNRLHYAVDDATEAGFVVYDDYAVEDSQVGGGVDRQAQATRFAVTIHSRAEHLVAADTQVSRDINRAVGDIGNYFNFDEPVGDISEQHGGVQLVDYTVPLSPPPVDIPPAPDGPHLIYCTPGPGGEWWCEGWDYDDHEPYTFISPFDLSGVA